MHVGIAYVPVSSAYSLVSTDFGKLKHVLGLLTPGLVFAADGARFAKAIAAAVPAGTEVLTGGRSSPNWRQRRPPRPWTPRTRRSARTPSPNSC